jgi:hypothetical protein
MRFMQQLSYYFCQLSENRITRPVKCAIVRSIAVKNPTRAILNRYYFYLLGDEISIPRATLEDISRLRRSAGEDARADGSRRTTPSGS